MKQPDDTQGRARCSLRQLWPEPLASWIEQRLRKPDAPVRLRRVAFRLFRDKQRPATSGRQRGFVEELQLARETRVPNGAGQVPAGEREPPELVVWHEFLDQRKELTLLKPDVCVKQLSCRIQRLSIDDAGRHGDRECASETLELHVLEACLAEGSRLRLDVPEQKREELFFLI